MVMIAPPVPEDEAARLELLRACKVNYETHEEAFDDVARLAADLCGTEIALITFVESDYQWFKARVGLEERGTPRAVSFCAHCINHRSAMVVEDTLDDPRFADNPLVTGGPKLRFYAGVPLHVGEGSAIGAICVAHRAPWSITPRQLESLERLGRQISRELRLRQELGSAATLDLGGDGLQIGPGSLVGGRWRLSREVGSGAAGVVFEARDRTGERAAIKILRREWAAHTSVVERFAREARVLAALDTPHVAKLLDVGNLASDDGGLPYLALEYLEGTDLDRILLEDGHVSVRDAFRWCADACDGVGAAHAHGVIHRDLKPSNVFLASRAGGSPTVKVLDFGIATAGSKLGVTRLSRVGVAMGTPSYMAPEQVMSARDVDARSDVWSIGAMVYELVSGTPPFAGESELEILTNVMTKRPVPLSAHLGQDVDPAVEAVVHRCLQRRREDRFSSMGELANALRAAAGA